MKKEKIRCLCVCECIRRENEMDMRKRRNELTGWKSMTGQPGPGCPVGTPVGCPVGTPVLGSTLNMAWVGMPGTGGDPNLCTHEHY